MKKGIWMMMIGLLLVVCAVAQAGAEEYCECDELFSRGSEAYCKDPNFCINCDLKLANDQQATRVYHYYSCASPDACKYCAAPYDYKQANTNDYLYGIVHEYGEYRYVDERFCAWSCVVCGSVWDQFLHDVAACTGCCIRCGEKIPGHSPSAEHGYGCDGVCDYCGAVAPEGETLPGHYYSCNGLCEECGAKAGLDDFLPEHIVYCTNKVCEYCGETVADLTAENVYVRHGETRYAYEGHQHWQVCQDCGMPEEYKSLHEVENCLDTVCRDCGGPILRDSAYRVENHGTIEYRYFNETYHEQVCRDCGEILTNMRRHNVGCDGKCTLCGASISQTGSHQWQYAGDDAWHWHECTLCGEQTEKQSHYRYCDDKMECHACGITYSGPVIAHLYEMYVYVDQAFCQRKCMECGEVMGEKTPHQVWCGQPVESCSLCSGYCVNPVVKHSNWGDTYEKDASHHWTACADCGVQMEKEPHWYYCTERNVCEDCGQEGLALDMAVHSPRQYFYKAVNAENHQQICTDCNSVVATRPHVDNDGDKVCNLCGGSMEEKDALGTWSQECYCASCGIFTTHTGSYDSTTHWGYCHVCGQESEDAHRVSCEHEAEGLCSICEGRGVQVDAVEHSEEYILLYDKDGHWHACSVCEKGMEEKAPHALDAQGLCTDCGWEKPADALPGDADGNGAVTVKDGLAVLRFVNGFGNAIDETACDVNDDGRVDNSDAQLILQHVAGQGVTLK